MIAFPSHVGTDEAGTQKAQSSSSAAASRASCELSVKFSITSPGPRFSLI